MIEAGYCPAAFYDAQDVAESSARMANDLLTALNWTKDRQHIVYQAEGETTVQTINQFSRGEVIRFRALDSDNPGDCFLGSIA